MRGRLRLAAAGIAVVCIVAAIAAALGSGSRPSAAQRALTMKSQGSAFRVHEALREGGAGDSEASEDYESRAYPADVITFAQTQQAINDAKKVKGKGSRLNSNWQSLGPNTLNVDRLGTQTYLRPTQWSGRVTALAVDPKCKAQECTLYVGAAGGGVWRSTNALAPTPNWKYISDGIPSNAVGSITVDPTDATGKTIYVGTGEANSSGDSEAGVGLYKTTDGGSHWTLVPGSSAAANNRSISAVAIDPTNANHIVIATRSGTRGVASNGGALTAPGPTTGVYESTDGGATFNLSKSGTVYEAKFDPSNPSVYYAAFGSAGLWRNTNGTWEQIFAGTRGRYSFSPVTLPNGKTRIYLSDANGGGQSSQAYRIDDASQPAATLTASNNAAWVRLSSPTDGTPGFASWGYCDGQCTYDMQILSPADRPDMVVLSGLMNYNELPPYAGADRSNGRAVLLSTDAGATWTDQTGDAEVPNESMHPDQHAIAFVPGNPDVMFLGSDGGVIRTSGTYSDASSQCDTRGLTGLDLTDCKAWLKRVPTLLQPINSGLGTLQLYNISISPFDENTGLAGTQDNGSINFDGSPTWLLGVTGDGGDTGFDAATPNVEFHTYYTGWLDVNFHGDDPKTWDWVGDQFFPSPPAGESIRMYPPTIADPVTGGTIFEGASHVWRTQDSGGDQAFLDAHCNTTNQFGTSDKLFTGACGDFVAIGQKLTDTTFGADRTGGNIAALGRGNDVGTLWAATSNGRVFVSKNANAAPASVSFTRIDTSAQPTRFPSSVTVDSANPNHAIVTYSGYNSNTPTTPGHVFDVVFNPSTGTATWTDISYDFGDVPALDSAIDPKTGDIYVSNDFGVARLVAGTTTWINAADGIPTATVSGLTLIKAKHGPDRLLYAATHGRGAYVLRLGP